MVVEQGDGEDGTTTLEKAKKWVEHLSQGRSGHEIETRTLPNLRILKADKGFLHCIFTIPQHLSDRDGNWSAGAIATLIDIIGAAAIVSSVGDIKVSVDFNISYFSNVKIHEQVEIVAKVLGHRGKLSSMLVEITSNGELIAIGKQWMASLYVDKKPTTQLPSKI